MMQKIYKIPLAISCLGVGSLLFAYLTFIPNQTFAEVVDPDNRTMGDIHYMQEMNTKICATAELEKQYQLIDIRDGKTYYVTRLADDMCWMTQNLDLDLYENDDGITLTTRDSDVTSDLEVVSSGASSGQIVIAKVTEPSSWPSFGDTYKGYYDPGDYVYTYNSGVSDENDRYKSVGSKTTCTNITTTSDLKSTKCNNYLTAITEENKSSLDIHYHIGNYYSWSAATLGSGDSLNTAGQKAEQSICPKGWKLPLSYSTNDSTPGSFNNLLSKYNVQGKPLNGNDAIYKKPLYFVYGGRLYSGNLNGAAYNGRYWSSIAGSPDSNSNARAYSLDFNDGSVGPSNNNYRFSGYSVRCVNDPEAEFSENLSTPDILPSSATANISVTVSPVISLDVATSSTSDKMTAEFTKVSTSEIITNVSSNYQYTVSISTEQTTLEQDPKTEYNIPMIGTGTNGNGKNDVEKSVSGWGIKKKLSATNPEELGSTKDEDKYSPVGIGSAHPEVFYKSNGAEALTNDKALVFEVGVGVDAKLPSGIYFTTVTLTAGVI